MSMSKLGWQDVHSVLLGPTQASQVGWHRRQTRNDAGPLA
jgi:hypothetical protein